MPKSIIWIFCGAILLGSMGCQPLRQWKENGYKVGPNYRRPCVETSRDWINGSDPSVLRQAEEMSDWWRVFNDPVLEQLVQAAYQQNLTLRVAGLRVLQARLQREVSQRNLFPQSQEAFGQYARNQSSRNAALFFPPRAFDDWDTGFDLSWEADVWGRFRRQIEADDASLNAQVENYDDILVTLIGDVAETYITLRSFDQRLQLAEQNVVIQQGSLELAETRLREGEASELDVQQAITNLKDTEALIPSLRQGRRLAVNGLAILLGMTPSNLEPLLRGRGTLPIIPDEVVVGIPANLLRRRPDIRRAERQIARESALIGVSQAELYPQFSLTGEINLNSEDLGDLFSSGSTAGFIAPGFRWKILNYGRLQRNVRIQELEFQTKILDYENAVLTAHQEVEDAMVQFLESRIRVEKLKESATAAARSVELVNVQYREGEVDFSQVFVLEGALVSSQDELVATQADVATALIRTYRALGGGWQLRLSTPYQGAYAVDEISAQFEPPMMIESDQDVIIPNEEAQSGDTDDNAESNLPASDPDVDDMESELRDLLLERASENGREGANNE
ncbi:MAG: efflux transporter outer membrane subunit [Planctomycetota bacterium]